MDLKHIACLQIASGYKIDLVNSLKSDSTRWKKNADIFPFRIMIPMYYIRFRCEKIDIQQNKQKN